MFSLCLCVCYLCAALFFSSFFNISCDVAFVFYSIFFVCDVGLWITLGVVVGCLVGVCFLGFFFWSLLCFEFVSLLFCCYRGMCLISSLYSGASVV